MEIIKILNFKFSNEEKEILNKALKFIRHEFGDSDICSELDCNDCPFKSLCGYHTAEDIEQRIHSLLSE